MAMWCKLVIAISFCFLSGCLNHAAFQGGKLTRIKLAPLFYDYLAEFQELDLNKNGQYVFEFRGFPSTPYAWLDLLLSERSGNDQNEIISFTPQVTMELDTKDGKRICRVTGKLNHEWHLESHTFRNPACISNVNIKRSQSYVLKITVEDAKENLGTLPARPRLYTVCC